MAAIRAATSGNGSVPAVWLFLRCFFVVVVVVVASFSFFGVYFAA